MKLIILFLSLLSFHFSFGQHYFGVKVAPGIQTRTYNIGPKYNSTFSMRSVYIMDIVLMKQNHGVFKVAFITTNGDTESMM
jgi:hypothetical protein